MRAPETIDRAVAIARGDALEGQNWAQLSPKGRDTAELGLRRVHAAGYRILGPDEVDLVTVEKVAALCLSASVEATNPSRACQADELGKAIRALGRKA